MEEFITGFRHFFAATAFLYRHKLLYFYFIPFLLGILFYTGITATTILYSRKISAWLFHMTISESDKTYNGFWSFLNSVSTDFIHNFAAIIVGLVIFLIASKFSKYLILILLSPLFAYLSELVEEKMTGNKYPFSFTQFIKDILRGIIIALRNLLLELFLIFILGIAGLFSGPLSLVIIPFLWLIGAYFYGFSMMDYTCERHKMSIRQSIDFVRKHKLLAIANGALYAIFDLVPIIGLTVAPINAVVGATTAIIKIENKSYNL